MEIVDLVGELESELRKVGDPARAAGAKAYLKSDLDFIGVAAKPLREVARSFLDRHINRISSLSLREGSKYLAQEDRDELKKLRSG